jgi:homoserine kinase type II
MAVYTEVSDEALVKFLADYDAGALLSFKGIAEGVENSNYLVITDRGQYILTLYEKRVAVNDLPFFIALMDHLASHGVSCPVPVKTKNGETLRTLSGRPAALISFLDGIWVRKPRPDHCAMLGAVLAQMHIAGQDFIMRRPNTLTAGDWRSLLESIPADEVDTIAPGLYDELDTELTDIENNWPEHLPQGVIHADLFPDNVFFLNDRLSGVIDFYFACTDVFAYDIAICLNAWCFEPDMSFNVTKARSLLSAYKQFRPFSEREYDALPILARGAAMRFLLTRIYDWLNTPKGALVAPKNPDEYIKILRFQRDVKTARAYGIDP